MFNLNAISSDVSVDGASGRPREIRSAGRRLAISALEAIRDETAAYPVETGPRTVFVVRADGRRFRLTHRLRDDRWTVEEIGAQSASLSHAA